jgi:Fe-S-cluster containining protein
MSDSCASCSGRCCYDIVVRVTPFDIWRISRGQSLRFDEIVLPWKEHEPTPMGVRIDATGDRYGTVLDKHPQERGACAFLMQISDDVKRCGIYVDRPLVCRVYPFMVRNGAMDVRDDARCKPSDWNLATLDYPAWRNAFGHYAAEWRATTAIAAAWNDRVERGAADPSFAAHLAFLEAVCDRFFATPVNAELERWNEALLPEPVRERHAAWLSALEAAAAAALPRRSA